MATNKTIKQFRLSAVPATWAADAIYYIAVGTDNIDIYVTDSSAVPKHVINQSEIQALIASAVSSNAEVTIVDDIAARNALPSNIKNVYVKDATADTTVEAGGAFYIYDAANSVWIKTAEAESLDAVLNWSAIQGKPGSSASDIDWAVTNAHTHNNKTQLDKVGEDANGNLMYNGALPYSPWEQTQW